MSRPSSPIGCGPLRRLIRAGKRRPALALVLALLGPAQPLLGQDAERIALVKAGFLVRFPEFISWPPALSQGPLQICILGPSALAEPLRSEARQLRYRGTAPLVRELGGRDDLIGCHLVFIPRERAGDLERILSELGRRPVLTVGDAPGLAERGVHVNLFSEGERVRFEINREAMERSSLTASFRLLEMARPLGR